MVAENPTWGAPRIHGELLMLGFDVSERTISRWVRRAPRDPEPAKRWLAFLRNHREAIAAMDFFTVPTVTFGVLYCFFVIEHGRRRILHFNVTRHPTSVWICWTTSSPSTSITSDGCCPEYVRYYHEDRTHLGLGKHTPVGRIRSLNRGAVVSHARLGGLHHRYDRVA
jgi:transposase InsO family protein